MVTGSNSSSHQRLLSSRSLPVFQLRLCGLHILSCPFTPWHFQRPARNHELMSETPTATASGVESTSTIIPIPDDVPAHHASPVVAFIIGLSIILLASILNAGGLNITKLDHVCHMFYVWKTSSLNCLVFRYERALYPSSSSSHHVFRCFSRFLYYIA